MSIKLKTAMECLSVSSGLRLAEANNLGVVEASGRFGLGRSTKGDLYLLVEATGPAKSDVERLLVDAIASEYEHASGSITAGLLQAVAAGNRRLYSANQKALPESRMTAGVSCAVIREGDLFLAQAGPALAYVYHQDALQRAPTDSPWLSPGRSANFPYSFELGQRPEIDPELFHSSLQAGDSLLMCSCSLALRIPQAKIKEALGGHQAAAVVDKLAALAGAQDFSAMVLEIMGEEVEEDESGAEEGDASAGAGRSAGLLGRLADEWRLLMEDTGAFFGRLASPFRRGRREGRPDEDEPPAARLGVPPRAVAGHQGPAPAPQRQAAAPVTPAPSPQMATPREEAVPPKRYQPPLFVSEVPSPPGLPSEPWEEPLLLEEEPTPPVHVPRVAPPEPEVPAPAGLAGVLPAIREGWLAAVAGIRSRLPGRAGAAPAEEEPSPEGAEQAVALETEEAASGEGIPTEPDAGVTADSEILGRPWQRWTKAVPEAPRPRPEPRPAAKPAVRWQLPALGAIAILALVAGGVIFSRYQQDQERAQRFSALLAQAQERRAAVTASTDRTTARAVLGQAEQTITQALELRPGDADAKALFLSIQTALDTVNAVVRLNTVTTLVEVPEDKASLGRLIVRGIDVFFMDTGQGRIYKYLLTGPNASTIQKLDVNPVLMRKGDEVSNIIVGDLVDILWMPAGGQRAAARFLALEGGGSLVEYVPTTGLQSLTVRDSQTWRKAKAAAGFNGNFYVLDTQQSQIHKYEPTAKGYESPAIAWMKSPTDLTNIVDMCVEGDIYLLALDGRILRFRGGEPLPFPLVDLDRAMANPASIFGTTDSKSLYVVDPGNKRIVQVGKEGGFQRQFRYGGKDDLFDALRSVYVDEEAGRIFITSGKRLLVADVPK